MKRAFLCPPITPSRALDRVRAALCADPRCGDDFPEDEADVVILQVVGRRDQVLRKAKQINARGQKFAVIQFTMRSTKTPHTSDWIDLWQSAACVWSYLPLDRWSVEDGIPCDYFNSSYECGSFLNFYHAPLGVDGDVFWYGGHGSDTSLRPPVYLSGWPLAVLSTGRGWLTESAREVTLAGRAAGIGTYHLGADIGHGTVPTGEISDTTLAWFYRQIDYVSGLRRTEGFELPAAEGLLCGARPLLFYQPWYRDWYGSAGIYLHEGDRECVLNQLIGLFQQPVRPVTQTERDEAARRFHWPTLVDGFLTRCLA